MADRLDSSAVLHEWPDRDALDRALAEAVGAALQAGLERRGTASLVVSGGRTPLGFLRALAQAPLDWSQVAVTLADERWVDVLDEASNERLLVSALSGTPAAAARIVGLKTAHADPESALAEVAARLATLPRPFDAVVLGMGDDGHTASLFPDAPQLGAAIASPAPVAALTPRGAAHARLSLTPAALFDAQALFLHITGDGKRSVLDAALGDGPVEALPVRLALRHDRPVCQVYWAP